MRCQFELPLFDFVEISVIKQICNGAKLLQLTFDKIRFIDLGSFFQMLLSAFPKTFGIKELGNFPHLFNTPEHQDYVGPVPALDCYMPKTMSRKGKQELKERHQACREEDYEFNFQGELKVYGESDVRLPKKGCFTFKHQFEEQTGFNPFNSITIASTYNKDFRMTHMMEGRLANEPLLGWGQKANQFRAAFEWFHWCEHQLETDPPGPPHLQHVGNRGDYLVPGSRYTEDRYNALTNTVYEFHGCFCHGCPTCFPH